VFLALNEFTKSTQFTVQHSYSLLSIGALVERGLNEKHRETDMKSIISKTSQHSIKS